MIDKYDFSTIYSLISHSNEEMQYIIRNEIRGLDVEDFEYFNALDFNFEPVSIFGKSWYTYILSTRIDSEKELDFYIVLDKLDDYIYVIYVAIRSDILIMRFLDNIDAVTNVAVDEVENLLKGVIDSGIISIEFD